MIESVDQLAGAGIALMGIATIIRECFYGWQSIIRARRGDPEVPRRTTPLISIGRRS
jgi:hypothetical protein